MVKNPAVEVELLDERVLKELRVVVGTNKEAQKKYRYLIDLLRSLGPYALNLPHNRHLKGTLFELRDMQNGLRYYYSMKQKSVAIVLVAGKKKDQKKELILALKRESEIEEKTA